MADHVALIRRGTLRQPDQSNRGTDLSTRDETSIGKGHAVIRRDEQGQYSLAVMGAEPRASLNCIVVAPGEQRVLHDGCELQFGEKIFSFQHTLQRAAVLRQDSLYHWAEQGVPAPGRLDRETLQTAVDLCGTRAIHRGQIDVDQVRRWCAACMGLLVRSRFPLPLPYLIDVGSLLLAEDLSLRAELAGRLHRGRTIRSEYARRYVNEHLAWLAHRPDIVFIRRRLAESADEAIRTDIVARFLRMLLDLFGRAAARKHPEQNNAFVEINEGRAVITDPLANMGFLITAAGQSQSLLRRGLDRVEMFLLGARPRLGSNTDNYRERLIQECLDSHDLKPADYRPDPYRPDPRLPDVPSASGGESTTLRGLRRTSRLEELPEVIPGDLVYLSVGVEGGSAANRSAASQSCGSGVHPGQRHLLERLAHEGLNKWERHSLDVETHRKRFLLVLVADIGGASNVTDSTGHSFNDHARRLIFETLRDVALHVPDSPLAADIQLDVTVLLEPGPSERGGLDPRLAWSTDLNELQHRFGRSLYDDMMDLEDRMHGYFFRLSEQVPGGTEEESGQLLLRLWEQGDYDLMFFNLLASGKSMEKLMPIDTPTVREQGSQRTVVHRIYLDAGRDFVRLRRGSSFDEGVLSLDEDDLSDEALRYTTLEVLLGRRSQQDSRVDLELSVAAAEIDE